MMVMMWRWLGWWRRQGLGMPLPLLLTTQSPEKTMSTVTLRKGGYCSYQGFNAMTLIEVTAIAHSKRLPGLFSIFDIFLFRLILLYKLHTLMPLFGLEKINQIDNRYFFSISMYCLMGIHFFYYEALIINFIFQKLFTQELRIWIFWFFKTYIEIERQEAWCHAA